MNRVHRRVHKSLTMGMCPQPVEFTPRILHDIYPQQPVCRMSSHLIRGIFPWGFSVNILQAFLLSPCVLFCISHMSHSPWLMTVAVCSYKYKLSAVNSVVIFSLPLISLCNPFWNADYICRKTFWYFHGCLHFCLSNCSSTSKLNWIWTPSPYRAVNTVRFVYKNQSVNVV